MSNHGYQVNNLRELMKSLSSIPNSEDPTWDAERNIIWVPFDAPNGDKHVIKYGAKNLVFEKWWQPDHVNKAFCSLQPWALTIARGEDADMADGNLTGTGIWFTMDASTSYGGSFRLRTNGTGNSALKLEFRRSTMEIVAGTTVSAPSFTATAAPTAAEQVTRKDYVDDNFISKAALKAEVAASTDFADFQARIAAL